MPDRRPWPDLLFAWMSERGSGSTADLTNAIHWLSGHRGGSQSRQAIQTRAFLRALSDLGMAENLGARWSVAPPVLTSLPTSGSSFGVLTGSRTPAFDMLIEAAAGRQKVQVRRLPSHRAPTAVLLHTSETAAFERLAREMSAVHVPCAAEQLAALLPPPGPSEWPEVFGPDTSADELQRFDPVPLRFHKIIAAPTAGLVEISTFGRTRYLFGDGRVWRHVRRAAGVYLELARTGRRVITWSAAEGGTLSVPVLAPMPTLPARAATLCSGVLPAIDNERLVYANVPQDVAFAIWRAVGQISVVQREGQNARA